MIIYIPGAPKAKTRSSPSVPASDASQGRTDGSRHLQLPKEATLTHLRGLRNASSALEMTAAHTFRLPFDIARVQYANAVRMGLVRQSMLAWANFERSLSLAESAAQHHQQGSGPRRTQYRHI